MSILDKFTPLREIKTAVTVAKVVKKVVAPKAEDVGKSIIKKTTETVIESSPIGEEIKTGIKAAEVVKSTAETVAGVVIPKKVQEAPIIKNGLTIIDPIKKAEDVLGISEDTTQETEVSNDASQETTSGSYTQNSSSTTSGNNAQFDRKELVVNINSLEDLVIKKDGDFISASEWNVLVSSIKGLKASQSQNSSSDTEENKTSTQTISAQAFSFQTQTWEFSKQKGSAAKTSKIYKFTKNIKKAEAWIKSWHLEYEKREYVKEIGIQLDLNIDANQVSVDISAPLKDLTQNYDDPYSGSITVVVFAEYEDN